MLKVCFFNHFHNGDCFGNKQFMVDLSRKLPTETYYTHFNDPKILADLPFPFVEMPECIFTKKNKWPPAELTLKPFVEDNTTIYVNTWIGCYVDDIAKTKNGVIKDKSDLNWKSYYRMWSEIYKYLSIRLGPRLELEPRVESYYPSINYAKFDVSGYDKFIANLDHRVKILISNGKALSNQSLRNHDMSAIICDLAAKYQDTAFICTYTFACDLPNVYFTDLIQERIGSDLNEISYLSTYCDAIVGRNSGPFLFTNTKENLASKTFLAFSRDHRECFPYECETKDFRYIRDRSDTVMVDALVQLIEDFK